MADLGAILNDPQFGKFDTAEKTQVIAAALKHDADFAKLTPDQQLQARNAIYRTAKIPLSDLPPVTTPSQAAGGVLNMLAPHSDTDAALMALSSVLPFAGKLAPAAEELSPELAKGLEYLGKEGLGPLSARLGISSAVGGATGGVSGAVQGAAQEGLGSATEQAGRSLSGLREIEGKAVKTAGETEADKAAQAAIEKRLGMTQQRAAELATPPVGVSPEATQLAQAKRAAMGARAVARKEVGSLYDPLYEPVDKLPVGEAALGKIGEAAQEAQATLASRGQDELTKPTRDLLDEFSTLGGAHLDPDAQRGRIADLLRGAKSVDPADKARFATLLNNEVKTSGTDRISPERLNELASQALGINQAPITIGALRGRLQALERAAVRPGITDNERAALTKASLPIRSALEDVIPDELKPQLHAINDAYAAVSRAYPFQDLRPLRNASTFPELGAAMFSKLKPDATAIVLDRADPAQKQLYRRAFSSWILNDNTSQKDIFNALEKNKALLPKLGFPEDFDKVRTWRELATQVRKIRSQPPDLPQTRAFMNGVREGLRKQGLTPELLDSIDAHIAKNADKGDMNTRFLKREMMLWGPMGLMAGYGWMAHEPAMVVPMAAYLARRPLINNPAYREFVMNGWARQGGRAVARLLAAGAIDGIKQYGIQNGLIRPDKAAENEAKP